VILSLPVGIGLLFLLASLIVLSVARSPSIEPFERIDQTVAVPAAEVREIELVVISPDTFTESSRYLQLELPEDVAQAYRRILDELRDAAAPLWPPALPTPTVFVVQNTVVLDFSITEPIRLTIARERALIETIETTLRRNGAGAVRFLVNQHEPETFLGHIVVNSSLD
jgi:hypothetical protein